MFLHKLSHRNNCIRRPSTWRETKLCIFCVRYIVLMRDFHTWLITQVTAARGAACQFPSERPVCPDCSVNNSQAA